MLCPWLCVCARARVRKRVHVCVCVCMCVWSMYVSVCVCVCVCVCACVRACACVSTALFLVVFHPSCSAFVSGIPPSRSHTHKCANPTLNQNTHTHSEGVVRDGKAGAS